MKEEKYLQTGELQLQFLPYLKDEVVGHGDGPFRYRVV
jgi:hypothetical protein